MEDKRLEATARLLDVMTTLRRECPWDREQTFDSLRSNTIEETYELADAITDHNMEGIKEELGDLLLHVVFYSKLGEEAGAFDYADVANALCDKLVYRHPHVYGDIHANTPDQVKENWEALKLRKKNRKSGTLGGVPRSLPALVKAFRVGEKAAATGFDWQKREDVWDKVKDYLTKAGTTIFVASIVLWFVLNFGVHGYETDVTQSFAAAIGRILVPVLRPAGLGTWQIAVALISGLSAKEVVVSSFSVLYGISNINSAAGMAELSKVLGIAGFGMANAYALLVFCLLYSPCVAAVGTIRRETKSLKFTMQMVLFQIALAWCFAVLIYQIGSRIF